MMKERRDRNVERLKEGETVREEKKRGEQRERLKSCKYMESTAQRQFFDVLERCRKHEGFSMRQTHYFSYPDEEVWRE